MSLGKRITEARKKKGMTLEDLGTAINMSRSNLSVIENDNLKGGPDPDTVNRIADALGDNSIRLYYLESNPVFQAVIPRIFPELNNIRTEPAIVFSRFADEAEEAMRAARNLSQVFAHANPRQVEGFADQFAANMEQIIDIQRCAEILMTALITAGVMSESEQRDLNDRQQAKCEANGHHLDDRRTGCDRRCEG